MMTMVEGTSIDLGDPIALDAATTAASSAATSGVHAAATIGANGDLVVDVETVEERCEDFDVFRVCSVFVCGFTSF